MKRKKTSLIVIVLLIFNISINGVYASNSKISLTKASYIKDNVMEVFSKNKENKNYKKDQILIKYKENSIAGSVKNLLKGKNIKANKKLNKNISLISFDSSKTTVEEQLQIFNQDPGIEYAEPNYLSKIADIPSDPGFSKQWGLKNQDSNIDVNILPAWNITKGNSTVVVGVLDTGIDLNHLDLQSCIWTNSKEIMGNGIDDDKNGYIDDYYGWDFADQDSSPDDDNGHGTHVSGIIAASHNGLGTAGAAPGVKILPLKVADSEGYIYSSYVVEAIKYGESMGVKIYNGSFGGADNSLSEKNAISTSPALFMFAAGNGDDYGLGINNDITPYYPASLDLPNIVSVAALDEYGKLAFFSNYGYKSVDIAAPGINIYSTVPAGYGYMNGTSMATPFVTGAAALIKSINTELTSSQIKSYILGSTHKLSSLSGKVSSGALIDIGGELNSIDSSKVVNVNGVSLDKSNIKLVTGSFQNLRAEVSPADASNKWVNWTSSNKSAAEVSDGVVTGKGAGTSVVTAWTVDGSKTASCIVTVGISPTPVNKTYITENEVLANKTINGDLYIGPNAMLTITGPVTVTGNLYVLGALVSYGGLTVNGIVYAKEFVNGGSYVKNGTVLELDSDSFEGTSTLTSDISIPLNIYGSNNKTIAVYGTDLHITGATLPIADLYLDGEKINYFSNGTFDLTIDVSNKTSFNFTITDIFGNSKNVKYDIVKTNTENIIPVKGITLDARYSMLNKTTGITLIPTVTPYNATIKDIIWTSSDLNTAKVDENGKVTAVGTGTVVITAKTREGEYEAACTVKSADGYLITPVRFGGLSRFDTAVTIGKAGWYSSDNVVLVNGYGFADALTGVPFAYLKNAPILLTSQNSLPASSLNEIVRLKAKNIYILGGTGVISSLIEDSLNSKGYNVIRIYGSTRFDTAIAIGNEVVKAKGSKTAIVTTAYNYPDALAISSYAAINGYPILYTETGALNSKIKTFLLNKGITSVIIPGGTGAVSAAVENQLKSIGISVTRIAGVNRYDTALNIVRKYRNSFDFDIMIATGANFPDALSGGVLAAKKGIPILLVDNKYVDSNVVKYIRSNGNIKLFILGGTGVITDNTVNLIK